LNSEKTGEQTLPPTTSKRSERKKQKIKQILWMGLLVLLLLFCCFGVFLQPTATVDGAVQSETEQKIGQMLSQMQGVGEASVVICQTEEGVESVVVVCEGAKQLQTVVNIREAVATALGIEQKAVKIYLKKQ
jgi:hypothetical protein